MAASRTPDGLPDAPTYSVVWPGSAMGVQPKRTAPRLQSLEGVRVGFLWDHLFRGDELFPVLQRELTARYPGIEIVDYDTFGNTHGTDEVERIATLGAELVERRIDAVVSAVGC